MSLVDIKTQARTALHGGMAVPCVYTTPDGDSFPTEEQADAGLVLTTRWHTKLARAGAITGGFDAEIIEGINRLVFQQPQLAALGITLEPRGVVAIAGYGTSYELDTEGETDGPLNVYWNVARTE